MLEELLGFDLLHDPYAEARAFYGEEVFQAILKHERQQREFERIRRATANDRIDDVAYQVEA